MTGWSLPVLTNAQLRVGLFPLNPRGYPSVLARSGPYLARHLLLSRLSAQSSSPAKLQVNGTLTAHESSWVNIVRKSVWHERGTLADSTPGGAGRRFCRVIGRLDGFPGGPEVDEFSLQVLAGPGHTLFSLPQVSVLSAQIG
jgi:hypothetical protein